MPITCYTTKDVADRLNVSERAIERLIERGSLSAFKGTARKKGHLITSYDLLIYLNTIAHRSEIARVWIKEMVGIK